MFDIDHFKNYNDSHGHQEGNRVLQKVAELLRQTGRRGDVLARYGGEEFVALLYGATAADAWRFAEAFRQAVATQGFAGEASQPLGRMTVSSGVATFPLDAQDDIGAREGGGLASLPGQGEGPQLHASDRGRRRSEPRPGGRAPGLGHGAPARGGRDSRRRAGARDRTGHARQRPLGSSAALRAAEGRPGVRGRQLAPGSGPAGEGRGAGAPEARLGAAQDPGDRLADLARRLGRSRRAPAAARGRAARDRRHRGRARAGAARPARRAAPGPRGAFTTRACGRTRPPPIP